MKTDRERGAVRIMESLSAVSEELLERCEKTGKAETPQEGKKYRYVYRYALACAACLCLIVVGTAYYGLNLRKGGASSGSPELSGGADGAAQMNGMNAPEAAPMEDQEAADMAPAAGEGMSAGGAAEDVDPIEELCGVRLAREPEWLDVSRLAALPGDAETEGERKESGDSSTNQNRQDTAQMETVETAPREASAQAAVIRVEAARVPEGYSLMQAVSDGAVAELENEETMESSLVRRWSNGEYSLWVRMTQTDLTADMRFEAEPPVYSVQEAWKESIPDAGADGYIRFALLYEDGMLAEYCGCLDSGEIVMLMESLAPQDPVR